MEHATLVKVNANEASCTPGATFALRGPAGEVSSALVRTVWKEVSS
jgi:hypothetical protein